MSQTHESLLAFLENTIRIFNGYLVYIENSVTRDSCSASQGLPNSYPEWRNFQFAPNNHYISFFLHSFPSSIVFNLDMHFLSILWWNKYTYIFIKKCLVGPLSATSWRHARGRLTPPGIRWKYPERMKIMENHARQHKQVCWEFLAYQCLLPS